MCHVCTKLQSYMYHVVNGRKHFYTLQKSQTRFAMNIVHFIIWVGESRKETAHKGN